MFKEIRIPVYPRGFYDFSDGVDVDNDTINDWIERCRVELEDKEPGEFSMIQSGNSFVLVSKQHNGYYYVVSKGYQDAFEDFQAEATKRVKVPDSHCWAKRIWQKLTGTIS